MKKDNIQLVPVKSFKIVIDNLSREIFDSDVKAKNTLSGKAVESRRKNIVSDFTISNTTVNDVDFDEFDRAVLDAAIAEQMAGNEVTTTERIFHRLGGKRFWTKAIYDAINESIEKFAGVRVTIEMNEAMNQLKYNDPKGRTTFKGYLLPTESLTTAINGKEVTAIRFLSKGVVFTVADLKNQIISCDISLLDIPVRTTPRTIAVKHYCLRRTLEIINSNAKYYTNKRVKPLRKTISFSDLLDKCSVESKNLRQGQQVKETVTKIFNFFVEKGIIKNWHFVFADRQKVHSIVIEN